MEKEIISSESAPKAIGPYSQAVRWGNLVFVSGQIPLDPRTNQVLGLDIKTQAARALENLIAVLKAAGSSLEKTLKVTVYLTDMGNFAQMNAVYEQYFRSSPPARATVEVRRLPKDVLIEMDAIAYV